MDSVSLFYLPKRCLRDPETHGLARLHNFLHRPPGLFDWHLGVHPVQVVKVDVIGPSLLKEPSIASRMRSGRPSGRILPCSRTSPVLVASTTRSRRLPSASACPTNSSFSYGP